MGSSTPSAVFAERTSPDSDSSQPKSRRGNRERPVSLRLAFCRFRRTLLSTEHLWVALTSVGAFLSPAGAGIETAFHKDPARSGRWGKATLCRIGAERAPIAVNFSYSVSGGLRLFAIRNDLLSGTMRDG
jgi:hypothetical protein